MAKSLKSSFPDDNVAVTDIRYKLVEFSNKSTEGIPLFKYDPLPDVKNRIRLLRLFAGPPENPHVECKLFEGEFSKDGQLIEPGPAEPNSDESIANGKSSSDEVPASEHPKRHLLLRFSNTKHSVGAGVPIHLTIYSFGKTLTSHGNQHTNNWSGP